MQLLRSTLITSASSLLRVAPPLHKPSVFFLMVFAICYFPYHVYAGSHVPYCRLNQAHAAYTPIATETVSRFPFSSSLGYWAPQVLTMLNV